MSCFASVNIMMKPGPPRKKTIKTHSLRGPQGPPPRLSLPSWIFVSQVSIKPGLPPRVHSITNTWKVISHDAAYFVNETISGARRYLVCTDLYSGYSVGSVLVDTPDHHYNVAKVLPRLITEIRTMANYTGTSAVYADAAPENMSKDLLAALEALNHPVTYASPNTKSRTNPNVESRISYTRACTRAFLIHAGAPPFLAGAAALDALEKRNDIVGADGLTPRQKLTGIMDPPRFDHWYQFGCLVYVFDESQHDKTKAR